MRQTAAGGQPTQYGLVQDYDRRSPAAPFPVQSSVLDEGALLDRVISGFRIPAPVSCRFLTRGDADVYRVVTATHNYYLKVYRPPRLRQQTEDEALLVGALSDAGIPVVRPVLRRDGRYADEVLAPEGVRPLLLFEEAPPPLPQVLDGSLLSQAGEQVARVHTAADDLDLGSGLPEADAGSLLGELATYTSRFLSEPDRAYLRTVSTALGRILGTIARQPPGLGLCHGDLVLSNLRLTTGGTITLLDFGSAARTWRAYDLAIVYSSLGRRNRDSRERLWLAFLRGYERIRALPESLRDHLKVMLVLRQISFLGGNCATLPLRLGTEPLETGFIVKEMDRLRQRVAQAGILREG